VSQELFLEAERAFLIFRGEEKGMAVGVDSHGDAVLSDQIAEEAAIALEVFGWPEEGGKYLSCGVVDGQEQDELRTAAFQPIVVAAVDVDEEARLWFAGSGAVDFRWPVLFRAGDASSFEDTGNRGRA
jgi:hypothetical protein